MALAKIRGANDAASDRRRCRDRGRQLCGLPHGAKVAAMNGWFGPEWNPVLIVLGVLAVLCVLATLQWWLGLAGVVAAICVFAMVTYGD